MRTSPRRRAREFVLQGLYQRQLSGNPGDAIRAQLAEAGGFPKADAAYFDALWAGVTAEYDSLVALLVAVSRPAGRRALADRARDPRHRRVGAQAIASRSRAGW